MQNSKRLTEICHKSDKLLVILLIESLKGSGVSNFAVERVCVRHAHAMVHQWFTILLYCQLLTDFTRVTNYFVY